MTHQSKSGFHDVEVHLPAPQKSEKSIVTTVLQNAQGVLLADLLQRDDKVIAARHWGTLN
jgi:hypothetical protein